MPKGTLMHPAEFRALRSALGYTQRQMAEALGYAHIQAYQKVEYGTKRPSRAVCLLAQGLAHERRKIPLTP